MSDFDQIGSQVSGANGPSIMSRSHRPKCFLLSLSPSRCVSVTGNMRSRLLTQFVDIWARGVGAFSDRQARPERAKKLSNLIFSITHIIPFPLVRDMSVY